MTSRAIATNFLATEYGVVNVGQERIVEWWSVSKFSNGRVHRSFCENPRKLKHVTAESRIPAHYEESAKLIQHPDGTGEARA